MRRLIVCTFLAAAVAAVAPGVASAARPAEGVTTIPVPHPIVTKINGVPMVELYDGGGGLPYLGASHPYNAGDWEDTLRDFHDSGVYAAELERIDTIAKRWIVREARGRGHKRGHGRHERLREDRHGHRAHHARRGQHGHRGGVKPALVLDIDETSLSNYSAIEADDFTFGENSQNEAVNEIGEAIEPTLELFNRAKRAGVTVFFITGRHESEREHTVHNLEREGYSGWEHLYLKPEDTTLSTVAYKSGAREDIESQGYRIVANIGDQYSDLAGGHATRAFKLANPFYFLP